MSELQILKIEPIQIAETKHSDISCLEYIKMPKILYIYYPQFLRKNARKSVASYLVYERDFIEKRKTIICIYLQKKMYKICVAQNEACMREAPGERRQAAVCISFKRLHLVATGDFV